MPYESRFNRIETKLDEHSSKLDEHTRILDEHSVKLDEHSRILDEHTVKLDEHTRKLDEHTQLIKDSLEQTLRHIDMLHEYWRSEFRALREQDRAVDGQQGWRQDVDVRLDVLTTSYRSVDKRVTVLEGKPGRKR